MADLNREDYRLVLPENVELRFDVAGVGSRVAAAIVDYIILYGGILVAVIAVALNRELLRRAIRGVEWPEWLARNADTGASALLVLGLFFAWWGYFLLFEMVWNGQTPGKRVFGLRVAKRDGQPVTAVASLVRNIVRAVDMFMLLGIVVMLFDGLSRRLGDFAAGTVVVREPRGGGQSLLQSVQLPEVTDRARALGPVAARLSMEHYSLIREYFTRAGRMSSARSQRLAASLAPDIASVMGVESADIGDAHAFLAAAARAFEEHHRYYESSNAP